MAPAPPPSRGRPGCAGSRAERGPRAPRIDSVRPPRCHARWGRAVSRLRKSFAGFELAMHPDHEIHGRRRGRSDISKLLSRAPSPTEKHRQSGETKMKTKVRATWTRYMPRTSRRGRGDREPARFVRDAGYRGVGLRRGLGLAVTLATLTGGSGGAGGRQRRVSLAPLEQARGRLR